MRCGEGCKKESNSEHDTEVDNSSGARKFAKAIVSRMRRCGEGCKSESGTRSGKKVFLRRWVTQKMSNIRDVMKLVESARAWIKGRRGSQFV